MHLPTGIGKDRSNDRQIFSSIVGGWPIAVCDCGLLLRPTSDTGIAPACSTGSQSVRTYGCWHGMVEASTEASGTGNIAIGSQLSGTVAKVCVRIGQAVHAGEVLFELDKRQAEADLRVREAALVAAEKQLQQLELRPRPEEVPPSEAQVDVAAANLRQQQDLFYRGQKLVGTGAITAEEFVTLEESVRTAQAQLALAKANLALLKAGTWEPDKAISRANVESAKIQVEQAKTTVGLLQVCAPVDGTILQINVRPGEYISTLGGQTLILMGSVQPLHVRVSIDEEDIPRLTLSVPARKNSRRCRAARATAYFCAAGAVRRAQSFVDRHQRRARRYARGSSHLCDRSEPATGSRQQGFGRSACRRVHRR